MRVNKIGLMGIPGDDPENTWTDCVETRVLLYGNANSDKKRRYSEIYGIFVHQTKLWMRLQKLFRNRWTILY